MAKSIADELYSGILKQSTQEQLGPSSQFSGTTTYSDSHDHDEDELWHDDGTLWNGSDEGLDGASDLDREWRRRRDQFHTIGYRDGLMAGKETSAQEGFNIGFGESIFVGYKWGLVRGATSALACLPDGLRVSLVESEDKRIKLLELQKSVSSLSTADGVKVFHDNLSGKLVKDSSETERDSQMAEAHEQGSSDNLLETYYEELQSLVLESPALKVNLGLEELMGAPKHQNMEMRRIAFDILQDF